MRFARYTDAEIQHRSDLATTLKYGALQPQAPVSAAARATDVPFPSGLAPAPIAINPKPDDSLPQADVIAMMDTAAEAEAMSDVLTPGHSYTTWYPYTKNFVKDFEPLIGPNGPSLKSKRLGSYFLTQINGLRVLVYKTELHMHEDAKKLPDGSYSLPIVDMFKQMIGDSTPRIFLTTGTSGGVYCSMSLGDVAVSRAAMFFCKKDFDNAPFNHKTFTSQWSVPDTYKTEAVKLMQGYAGNLASQTSHPPATNCGCSPTTHPTQIYYDGQGQIAAFHPILTTDFFEYGTSTNRLDLQGMAVEMDDATLGLACSQLESPPQWACIRNLSDPTINGALSESVQGNCAEYFYTKFGYWTTVMSAITTWSVIAGLGGQTKPSKAAAKTRR
jgi:nucleoside phosphorylase